MQQLENDSASPTPPTDVATLSVGTFAPYVGQPFDAIGAGNASVPLVLERATATPQFTLPGARRTTFSLLFSGPLEGPHLDGMGTYILRHQDAGDFPPLSMSRVVPPPGGKPAAYYQLICG
jgi:hypothetical protein